MNALVSFLSSSLALHWLNEKELMYLEVILNVIVSFLIFQLLSCFKLAKIGSYHNYMFCQFPYLRHLLYHIMMVNC